MTSQWDARSGARPVLRFHFFGERCDQPLRHLAAHARHGPDRQPPRVDGPARGEGPPEPPPAFAGQSEEGKEPLLQALRGVPWEPGPRRRAGGPAPRPEGGASPGSHPAEGPVAPDRRRDLLEDHLRLPLLRKAAHAGLRRGDPPRERPLVPRLLRALPRAAESIGRRVQAPSRAIASSFHDAPPAVGFPLTFDLRFAADVGQDPSFTLKPRVGLNPDTPVKVEIGSAHTGLPNGLTADLRYVCREGATRVPGRLSVGIEAGQRGQRHRGGREGQSHSVAVEVGRGEPTPAVGASSAATASPNASPSALSTPPLELVALARKVRVPAEENVPYRVELDAIFVTEPDRSEEEHDVAEELNMRRYPDREGRFLEAGKRPFKIDVSFSTEPSRPIRTLAPFALEDSCRRGLAKEGAVLMAISINGQVDVEA